MPGAKLERTRWPGIYRRGDRWAYEWTDAAGKRRRASADSREQASARKADEEAKAACGEFGEAGPRSRLTLAAYALDLFGADVDREDMATSKRGRYQGRRGAIRDSTRDDYRRHLERTWLPKLGPRPLAKLTAPDIARAVAELADLDGDGYLADRSIRRIFAPLSALLATAVEEGHLPYNVARDVRLPSGRDALRKFDADDQDDGDDPAPGKARALTRRQLAAFVLVVPDRWRLLFTLLAATGLRISEALAIRWGDLQLDGARPAVRVRRAYVRGVYGPPKSKHGRRDVPLPFELVRALRERRVESEWHEDRDLVFPSMAGTPMDAGNLYTRTLKPALEEGRRRLGRLPRLSARLRVHADRGRPQHRAGEPVARAPLAELHARRLRPFNGRWCGRGVELAGRAPERRFPGRRRGGARPARRSGLIAAVPIDFPHGADRLPAGRHKATVEEIEATLVDAFPASACRRPLFELWRDLIAAIERVLPMEEHWLDGSFVTTKLDPGDIDVVTHFEGAIFDALDGVDVTLLKGLVSKKISEALHGCDSYFLVVYPPGHPGRSVYEAAYAYWDGWFGQDRGGNPKGYVEVVSP